MISVKDSLVFLRGCVLALASVLSSAAAQLDIPIFAGGYGTAFYEETAREFEQLRPGANLACTGPAHRRQTAGAGHRR